MANWSAMLRARMRFMRFRHAASLARTLPAIRPANHADTLVPAKTQALAVMSSCCRGFVHATAWPQSCRKKPEGAAAGGRRRRQPCFYFRPSLPTATVLLHPACRNLLADCETQLQHQQF